MAAAGKYLTQQGTGTGGMVPLQIYGVFHLPFEFIFNQKGTYRGRGVKDHTTDL